MNSSGGVVNQELRNRILACPSMPALPAAAVRVLQMAQNERAGTNDLAAVIARDVPLSNNVLRAVNSPFYGLPQPVTSVQQAAALLGLHSVKTLVLGFSLCRSLRQNPGDSAPAGKTPAATNPAHQPFWQRSMYGATAARVLATRVMPRQVEDCFVAALLMDMGTLVLDQVLGDPYRDLCGQAPSHAALPDLESRAFGVTHAQAGALLASEWKLPRALEIPMGAHHQPKGVSDQLLRRVTGVLSMAGRCADVFVGNTPAESISALRQELLEEYQIGEMESDTVICELGAKTGQLAPLFDIPMQPRSGEDILAAASNRLLELAIARQNGESQTEADKRQAARISREGTIVIIPCTRGILGAPVKVGLKDLSTCGIGIVQSRPMSKGAQFLIQLPQSDGKSKCLLYTVVRCSSSGAQSSIGAELSAVLRPQAATPAESTPRAAG